MINIIIIEDSEDDYKYLADAIHRYAEQSGEVFSVKHYVSALLFLNEYKADADIIFMDIELPDINGVLASEKLRTRDSDVALVFVTNLAHLAIKGYSVSATDFIVKPINYYKLSALLGKIIKKVKISRDDYISVTTVYGVERISLGQILYVEAEAHRITYHLTERKITYSGTLSACEKILPAEYFIRCYQSFIINLKYVASCNGTEITMTDGTVIPLSRARRKEVMAKLAAYFHKGKFYMIFFQELLVYIPYYLECFLLAWMMLLPYKRKPHYKRNVLLLLIIGVFWQILISSLIYINTSSYEVIVAAVKFLLCVFPVYFLYTAYYIKFLKMLYIVVIALLFQRWTSVFADIIVSFTPLSDIFLFGRVIAWLSFGVLALVIWLFYIRLINKDTGAEIDGITILLFVLLFSLFEVFQTIIRAGTDSRVWRFVLSLLELAFGIFMLSQSVRIAERNRKMAERMVSDALLAKERQQFELLKQNMESIKSQAHDLKYIMRAIQAQGLQGDVAGKLHNLVQTYESSFNTGNPALDIILGDAEKNFRSRGIKFECFTDACDLSFMENFDLYSLLGNAFDNAAEYLDTVNEEKRYVSCSVRNENGGFIFIEVSNYYEGERDIYIGIASSKSDKTMHGYGMKNMQRVTEKYGGELQVQAENGAFYVTVLIPLPPL